MKIKRSRPLVAAPKAIGFMFCSVLAAGCLWHGPSIQAATTAFISKGSLWKYLDNGTDQGTVWRDLSFNDSAWSSGAAQLGYGDGDETTVVSYGSDPNNKYVTTYFRHSFSVADPTSWVSVNLGLLRDDGAVVYLNGTEVYRSNMPSGEVNYTTYASTALGGSDETAYVQASIDPGLLLAGDNLLAVEIHQANGSSSDISFDFELTGGDTVQVVRGPYLQQSTPNSMILRWRTDAPTESVVRYGSDPAALDQSVSKSDRVTEHEVLVTGLSSWTQYYYSVGDNGGDLVSGSSYYFYTPPPVDSELPLRVWVLGDSGTADDNARAVRDAYKAVTGTRYTDLWLMLGDNAYQNGTDEEYQSAVFDMYPAMLAQTVLWPTLGNHDTAGSVQPPADLPYFQMFTLPTNAEAGGVASGTERYYSFDYGNIHFVCLDSMTSDRSPTGAMAQWVEADLADNLRPWTIAFWHHPPYSKGSHNSDTETPLVEMRETFLPILEDYGVDLMLAGHSHSYERSFLLDGHYGDSSTFQSWMKLDGGSGRPDESEAYEKPTEGPAPHEGAVYAVAGSSGKISGGTLDHPAMYISLNQLGSMILEVEANRLNAQFLNDSGNVSDYFSIVKGVSENLLPNVQLIAPIDGAVFEEPADILLEADAYDSDGSIAQVDFYANGAWIGQDSSGPYQFTWSGVGAGDYSLTAKATDDLGASSESASVQVSVQAATVPEAPASLAATALDDSRIELGWQDLSANEDGVEVERSLDGSLWNLIATISPDTAMYTDSGLSAETTYFYRVRAFNTAGYSAYSNVASDTTLASAPEDFFASGETSSAGTVTGNYTYTHVGDVLYETLEERESGGKPETRHSYLEHEWFFDVTGGDTATFHLQAQASQSQDGDAFAFYFRTEGSAEQEMLRVDGTTLPSEVQSYILPAGISGRVYVRVLDTDRSRGHRALDWVAVDQMFIRVEGSGGATPPNAPSGLAATTVSASAIELQWTDNSSDEQGFSVERSADGVSWAKVGEVGTDVVVYQDQGLEAATSYDYRVRAFNAAGASDYSNVASATTDTAGSIVLEAVGYKVKGNQMVDLTWSGSLASHMEIYRDGILVTVVLNSGSYTDDLNTKGGGSYTYAVCENGGGTCSNQVLVDF